MTELFLDGWPNEEIFNRFERGEELSGDEALALLCANFSNATHNSYDAEKLFDRVISDFSIKIKKK